uniref:Odorant receptor n=1 Tax=Histia rhodope TaxID=1453155 RepID=A0A7G4KBV3_9NEOP|nr:odorant receptor [Histia rhodope]
MSSSRRQDDPQNTSSIIISIIMQSIQFIGVWSSVGYKRSIANFATICFILTIGAQVINLVLERNDSEKMMEAFSVFSVCLMGLLKYISLRRNSTAWQYLLSRVSQIENEKMNENNDNLLDYETDDDNKETVPSVKHVYTYNDKAKFISTVLTRFYTLTVFMFVSTPIFEYFWKTYKNHEPMKLPHILPGWTPQDDFHFCAYFITVACEAIAAVYCVRIHVTFDVTFVTLMIFSCGQFNYLWVKSERIGGSGNNCQLSIKRDKRANFRIMQCHKSHIMLVDLVTRLNKLLKIILGVYFTVITLTLCTVAVRLRASDKLGLVKLILLLQYMATNLMQLYLYCRYGDALLNQSSINMGEGPFGAAWWALSPPTRRHLSLLAAGMSRQQYMSSGIYIDNLPAFLQVT